MCVCVCCMREVEIERFDAVTAANYCCSIFHTVCLISCPVERDRDSLCLFLANSHVYAQAQAHTHTLRGHKEEKEELCSNY